MPIAPFFHELKADKKKTHPPDKNTLSLLIVGWCEKKQLIFH